jgi:hypothetical protein
MKSRKGMAFVVVAFVALVGAAQSAAGPSTVTTGYTVGPLAVPGASTGLVLNGDSVTVTATGTVCPGTGWCFGPDGDASVDTTQSGFGGFVAPGAPGWGLVGRVGSGPWVQIGSGPTTLSGTGELVFAVNDDLFSDNAGSFTVTVSYACWPGWGYGDENHTHCGPPGLADKDTSAAAGPVPSGNANGHAEDATPAEPGANGNGKAKGHTK